MTLALYLRAFSLDQINKYLAWCGECAEIIFLL